MSENLRREEEEGDLKKGSRISRAEDMFAAVVVDLSDSVNSLTSLLRSKTP